MLTIWEQRVRKSSNSHALLWGIMEGYLIIGGEEKTKKANEILELIKESDIKRAIHASFKIVVAVNHFDTEKQLDEYCYEILTNALEMYEDGVLDTEDRKEMISVMMGYLCTISCLEPENYDNLASNVTKYAYQLLRKQD